MHGGIPVAKCLFLGRREWRWSFQERDKGNSGAWLEKSDKDNVIVHNLKDESIIVLGHESRTLIMCAPSGGKEVLDPFIVAFKRQLGYKSYPEGFSFRLLAKKGDENAVNDILTVLKDREIKIKPDDEHKHQVTWYDSKEFDRQVHFNLRNSSYFFTGQRRRSADISSLEGKGY